jgi:opacity protein-like surface antigen
MRKLMPIGLAKSLLSLLLAAWAGLAHAQSVEPPPDASPAPAKASKQWEFATIGYAWFASAKGETDVIGPVEPVGLDLSFGDVLKAFKFAFMGAAEARHDRIFVLGDLTFIHLDAKHGIDIRDQDFLDAELDSRTAEITLLSGYRAANKGPVTVDLLAGGRMNWFKATLQLDGPNRSADGSKKESWFDPLVAARVHAPLGGKWSTALYGDIGGFGMGSDLTWQGNATVNYQLNHKMTLGAGWRYFKVNYDRGDFLYDVAQSGPIITFRTDF